MDYLYKIFIEYISVSKNKLRRAPTADAPGACSYRPGRLVPLPVVDELGPRARATAAGARTRRVVSAADRFLAVTVPHGMIRS
jgi:hypothetical protein